MRIPIEYTVRTVGGVVLPLAGSPAGGISNQSPTVGLCIGWNNNFEQVRALIDTGGDEVFVDEALLRGTGCPDSNTVLPIGIGGAEPSLFSVHYAQLIFDGQRLVDAPAVVAMPIERRAFRAILGTRFLERGRLFVDHKADSYFEFYDDNKFTPVARD